MRRIMLLLGFLAGCLPTVVAAQPPAVPALPDSERRTSYSISATTCACSVGFALYGDSTDIDAWLEVWLGGVRYLSSDATFGWGLSSVTGTLSTIPRPITDAVLTFNAVQTGTVQIVGARRPRRTSQFSENRGVAARDLNQVLTDIIAVQRETWDRTSDVSGRAILGLPGETLTQLPAAATRAGGLLSFDGSGNPIIVANPASGTGTVLGPVSSTNNGPACWSSLVGLSIKDCGNTTFAGTVGITGTATLSGATTVGGTFGVTGATTLSSTLAVTGKASFTSTDSIAVAKGTTGQRNGSPVAGDTRYNSTLNGLEFWNGTFWATLAQAPTVQTFTSGTTQTYTPATGVVRIRVRMAGGGGGGGGATANAGTVGNDSSFGSWTAKGGTQGGTSNAAGGNGGTGGVDGTGTKVVRLNGGKGDAGASTSASTSSGGAGGGNPFGGAGAGAVGAAGSVGGVNTGAGGAGGGGTTAVGGGGGAGEYVEFWVTNPSATTYTVGAAANGGAAGGAAGGNGAAGIIAIEEFYQ